MVAEVTNKPDQPTDSLSKPPTRPVVSLSLPQLVAAKLLFDPWGRLVLTEAGGRQHVGVEVVRAFPLSSPRRGLSVFDGDGRELAWIDDLDALPPELRRTIEEQLSRREFVPIIRRVHSISAAVEPSDWEVETDRGRTRFLLKSEEDVHPLSDDSALITDAHGIRYLIPDIRRLDPASRRLIERFL
jgi:uncharacterized protein DUF1854